MSNAKGNAYPLLLVSNNYQVQAVDKSQKITNLSNEMFAMEVCISEDGTIWALSVNPDPDGGGAKLFWSDGDQNWNEINTPDPGGIQIAGYTGSSCIYLSGSDGALRSMDTNGTSTVIYDNPSMQLVDFDYGGGKIWGILPPGEGKIPILQYMDASSASSASWTPAGSDDYYVFNLSVNSNGACYGVDDYAPVTVSTSGEITSAGSISKNVISITYKNANFVLTDDGNAEGNLVYEWTSSNEGEYSATNFRAMRIASTYYQS